MGTTGNEGGSPWATVWTTASQGPYPAGKPTAQPDLSFAFPNPARGACDQSFRMVLRPSLWGSHLRLRFSNALGARPIHLSDVHAGLHEGSSAVIAGTNRPVLFGGASSVVVPPGACIWSDALSLAHLAEPETRKLAVSFHVEGESGPMTWHAKALQTSYVSPPHVTSRCADEGEAGFPYPTTSWFFLDAVDMRGDAPVVVCFGDSITDGSASTINGDDRWPDVLSRRLNSSSRSVWGLANQGISGNRVLEDGAGQSALARLDRDVLAVPGAAYVIVFEGVNDLGISFGAAARMKPLNTATAALMIAGYRQIISRAHSRGIKVIGATIAPYEGASYWSAEGEAQRQAINQWIRSGGEVDGVLDFDAVLRDPAHPTRIADGLHMGDHLHGSDAGYEAVGQSINLKLFR